LQEKLAALTADQLITAQASGAIAHTVEGGLQAAKLLAAAIAARGRIGLIASPDGERVHFTFARPPGSGIPMNELLKSVLPIVEGRGGGSTLNAQGSGKSSKLKEALSTAQQQVDHM
jgi:alanyl-tRNA synthetase